MQRGAHPRLGSSGLLNPFNKGGQAFPSLQCPGCSMDEGSCMQGAWGHRASANCPVLAAHCPHHLLCARPRVAARVPCGTWMGHLRTGPPALIHTPLCLILRQPHLNVRHRIINKVSVLQQGCSMCCTHSPPPPPAARGCSRSNALLACRLQTHRVWHERRLISAVGSPSH